LAFLCDTHCHLYLDQFDQDFEAVIERASLANVKKILVPGIDLETSRIAIELADRYSGTLFSAAGIHPNYASQVGQDDIEQLRNLLKNTNSIRAIAEIGLDFYREWASPDDQRFVLGEMLKLAEEFNLPICLHVREAAREIIAILDPWFNLLDTNNHPLCANPGVFHSYDGTSLISDWAINHNFKLGISGPVTYKKAGDLRDAIVNIGLDRLILETDSPYLTPQPQRGKRNEPAFIPLIAAELGKLFSKDMAEIAEKTSRNAENLFKWQ
jgi:TatD DNase family protein